MVKQLKNISKEEDANSQSSETSTSKKTINRKKRAKKSDLINRNYECPYCHRKYMSMPALCTHKKQKHSLSYNPKDQKVNKIDEEANAIKFEKAKQKYIEFFNDENKISKFIDSTDNTDQKEKIKQSFNSDLVLNFVNKSSNYENIEQHPFYQQINKYWDLDQTKTEEKPFIQKIKNNYISTSKTRRFKKCNAPSIDKIFLLYLKQLNKHLKNSYLTNITLFIIYFRKFINEIKQAQTTAEIMKPGLNEFTQLFNARDIPEIANDFFNDFMPKYSDIIDNGIRKEFIGIIQHFCFWLYDNNYSDAVLSLNE